MVLYAELIKSRAEFHVAWLLGTGDTRKLSRREILSQNLTELCDSIIAMVPDKEKSRDTTTKTGLYLLSLLTYGTVVCHRVQVDFLQKDAEKLKEAVRRKNFISRLVEKFDQNQLTNGQTQNDCNNNQESTPIASMVFADDLVDLAKLPAISEFIGINGDPREFTMMDALPTLTQWCDKNIDLTGLYGFVEPYSRQNDYSVHSTFVEGNGSDEHSKEKRAVAVIHDFDDFVAPQQEVRHKKRSEPVPEPVLEQQSLIQVDGINDHIREEPLRFSECKLVELHDSTENHHAQELPHNPTNHSNEETEEPQPHLPAQLQDLDLVDIPPDQQHVLTSYFHSIASMPKDDTVLPPIPNDLDLFDDTLPPPAKRSKATEPNEEEVRVLENIRRAASSRPVTPVNPNELTELHSTFQHSKHLVPERSPALEIDSQIRDIIPQRKKSRRNLAVAIGDDLEIDEAVRSVLEADFSSLVKTSKDVKVNFAALRDTAVALMNTPLPSSLFGRRVPEEVRRMFPTKTFQAFTGSSISISDEQEVQEEKLEFATICLWSPQRLEPERGVFDEEYMPVQQSTLIQQAMDTEDAETLNRRLLDLEAGNLTVKYTCLLPTPEKQKEFAIMDDLQLDPVPIAGNLENFDFSNAHQEVQQTVQIEPNQSELHFENARHRQKSSLGVRHRGIEELEDFTFDIESRQRENERHERMRLAMQNKEENEDLFIFSSGSLLPDNRLSVHKELLTKAKEKYPEWIDFTSFTANHGRKKAATAFEGLLLSLKNVQVRAKQDEPFGTILVQYIEQDST